MQELTLQQQERVEENMGLVGMVLRDYVHTLPPGSLYTYEDLYQIGCIGLCKAVQTDMQDHKAAFSTYACRLIRNEIYDALEYSTRRGRELSTDPGDMPCTKLEDDPEEYAVCSDLLDRLSRAEASEPVQWQRAFRRSACLLRGIPTGKSGNGTASPPTM